MGLQLQMSWQPSLLSHKRKNGPPLGLKNLGNSCYLNSVLQCLTYTPPLANFCLRLQHSSFCDSVSNGERKRECPFCILEKRIVRSLSLELTLDAPVKILDCLRIFAEHFRSGRQEDAHEFLRYVIDACHNTCLRLMKLQRRGNGPSSGSNTVVKEIFGGAVQSQVKCLSCNSESNKVDEIMDISLDILHSSSLREAMQKFFQPEILDGSNKYRCENCKKLVTARKQMSILQAPNILVIQLKRFEGVFGSKIDKAIAFEEVLVLSSFMCKGSQDPRPEYNLFGTIVHSGYSPESGHYYSYIKDAMGRWYCCNDSYVTLSTLQNVLSEKVYILFFSRTNRRSVSSRAPFTANGVRTCNLNGSESSTDSKVVAPKKVPKRVHVEQSFDKDIQSMSKVDIVPSSPRVKFNILGYSSSKRVPPTVDGKADSVKNQNMKMNGTAKNTGSVEKFNKDMPPIANGNGVCKNKISDDVETCQAIAAASEEGVTQNCVLNSVKSNGYEVNGTMSRTGAQQDPSQHELQNGVTHGTPELKRKLEDSYVLLAQDAQSQAKVEELKDVLKQEASLVLQSCGWASKVYNFMCSRKKLCAREAGNLPGDVKLKKHLIAEAKSTFISQIPESLKEDLIKRLRSFSQEK